MALIVVRIICFFGVFLHRLVRHLMRSKRMLFLGERKSYGVVSKAGKVRIWWFLSKKFSWDLVLLRWMSFWQIIRNCLFVNY